MNELVMIVDDDEDLREAVALFIEARGFRTVHASDGIEALDKLEQGTLPSLILLDLRMPRMNGIEFLHAVSDTPAADIPVVAFTGDAGAANNALRSGAVACLRKPVEPRAVLDAICSRLPGESDAPTPAQATPDS